MAEHTAPSTVQSYSRNFVLNVLFGILKIIFQMGVSLFLVSYVVRKLGPERYSLIVIATAVIVFLGLIQLGASAGIGKQLNAFHTRGEWAKFRQYFSAGMLITSVVAVVIAIGVVLLLTVLWPLVKIPAHLSMDGHLVLAAIGATSVCACLRLPAQASLQAIHRVDIIEKWNMIGIAFRAIAVVVLFRLFAPSPSLYGAVLFGESLLTLIGNHTYVHRHHEHARLQPRTVTRAVMADLVGFNLLTLFDNLNYVLYMQSPVFVLQQMVSLPAAGFYGIGLQLNNLIRGVMIAVFNAFSPVAVSLEAKGEYGQLAKVFRIATKAFVAVGAVLWVGMFFLGRPFLHLWLKRAVPELADALPWLMAGSAVGVGMMPAAALVVALRRMKVPAGSGLVLAVAMVITMILTHPARFAHPLVYVCQLLLIFFSLYQFIRFFVVVFALHIRAVELLDMAWRSLLPALAAVPVCLGILKVMPITSLTRLLAAMAAVAAISGLAGLAVLFTREERGGLARLRAGVTQPEAEEQVLA